MDESWLIPYADILTLLLALFIVLFASSKIDAQKFEQISQSFDGALNGGSGVLEHEASVEQYGDIVQFPSPAEVEEAEEMTLEEDYEALGQLEEKITGFIEEKGLSSKIQTEMTGKGLVLKITEGVLYASGSADITEGSRAVAKEISNLLVTDPPRKVFIEGHTDNVPATSAEFPSNWELSSARAINFMKILLENDELDPKKFSATGYAEYHPVAPNDTAQGKAKNRRVEVLISPYEE
ncbi:flagellar motor protein MotB [Planococcus salinus]|nr:flagellar motor protein MotB [Planococcus salinus]